MAMVFKCDRCKAVDVPRHADLKVEWVTPAAGTKINQLSVCEGCWKIISNIPTSIVFQEHRNHP